MLPRAAPTFVTIRALGGEKLRNRDYIANALLRLSENRGFSRILDASRPLRSLVFGGCAFPPVS